MLVAAHAMLRAEQSHEFDPGSVIQDVDGRAHVVVHSGRIGYQSHALSLKQFELLLLQDFDTSFDSYLVSVCQDISCKG